MQDAKNNYRDYEIKETLDRGTGRPIEEPYWIPSTFARQEVINPVTNSAATVSINVAVAVTREVNLN